MKTKMTATIALVLAATLFNPPGAHAANNHDAGAVRTELGAEGSAQSVQWDRGERKVRLWVFAAAGMSSKRCMEATFDWRTKRTTSRLNPRNDGGHYDQRSLRNCKPGSYLQTDPDGDGFWNEPEGWSGRNVNGVLAAGGLLIKEGLQIVGTPKNQFGDRATLYGAGSEYKPMATEGQYLISYRTLYESGKIVSTRMSTAPESCMEKAENPCKYSAG